MPTNQPAPLGLAEVAELRAIEEAMTPAKWDVYKDESASVWRNDRCIAGLDANLGRPHDMRNAIGIAALRNAAKRLLAAAEIVATHEICHDLHGRVGPREFADGCAAEQRKLFGCAPDADEAARLQGHVDGLEGALRSLACWLGVGGYNAPSVTPEVFERKIRDGVNALVRSEAGRARGPQISDSEERALLRRANSELADERDQLRRDLAAAREEVERMRALLKPFAGVAERVDELQSLFPDDCALWPSVMMPCHPEMPTVGDCRRARAALAPPAQPKEAS